MVVVEMHKFTQIPIEYRSLYRIRYVNNVLKKKNGILLAIYIYIYITIALHFGHYAGEF